jgi:cation transport protein ChaC
LRREILIMPPAQLPRWIRLHTEAGPMTAIAFVVDRKGPAYVSGLPTTEIADMLARAAGPYGTMAEYLQSTVRHLEDRGLHDGHLWHLQELVAERIEAAAGTERT